jgi:hypothetical protein
MEYGLIDLSPENLGAAKAAGVRTTKEKVRDRQRDFPTEVQEALLRA